MRPFALRPTGKRKMFIAAGYLAGMATLAQDPLVIPDTISGAVIDLSLQTGTVQYFPGPPTQTMGANGPVLGPTLLLNVGQWVTINVENQLGEPTTVHWHGMHVPPEADGGPHTPIAAGDTWSPTFEVLEKASTHWYHPHLHMHTNEHVVRGLAGFIFIRDAEEAALTLPRTYGVDDLPLAIQTKEFDANNQVVWDGVMDTTVMVNATIRPYHEVPAQVIRLRLLNGASERSFNLGFSNDMTFHQIASDGGLLAAPVAMTRLRLAPGERAEVLVDLAGMSGASLFLRNFGSTLPSGNYGAAQPGMGAGQQIPGYTSNPLNGGNYDILRLDVISPTTSPVTTIPTTLVNVTPWSEADVDSVRTFMFNPVNMGPTAIQGPFTINMMPFDMMMINFDVFLDNIEVWELTNETPISHPFHVHDVQFYILSINGAPPPPNMQGRKDVVLVPGGMGTVRFITKFENHWSMDVPYMYHCHMLTHEDDGMMGQFRVIPNPASTNDASMHAHRFVLWPNPVQDRLFIQRADGLHPVDLLVVDALGRSSHSTRMIGDRAEIDLAGIAPGCFTLIASGPQGRSIMRFVKH